MKAVLLECCHHSCWSHLLTYCFSLGVYSRLEQGKSQGWSFLFRLSYRDDISNRQMTKRKLSEGWGLGGGWFAGFLPSTTRHDHIGDGSTILRKEISDERKRNVLSFSLQHSGAIRMCKTHADGFKVFWEAIQCNQYMISYSPYDFSSSWSDHVGIATLSHQLKQHSPSFYKV